VFIWLLVIPGILLTHLAVGKLIGPISDLPANIVKGFDEVFKFAYLEQDSKDVKASAGGAVGQCSVGGVALDAATVCPTNAYSSDPTAYSTADGSGNMNTVAANAAIQKSFATSLSIVQKVANDKYFGTEELQETADSLNKITQELNQLDPSMPCVAGVPAFCGIWDNGDKLVQGMAQVQAEIDKFEESDMIERWDEHKGILTFLHAVPYIMVIGLLFFTIFWWRGGVCCCCRDGTKCGTFALIGFVLCWLLSFIIYLVVLAVGCVFKFAANRLEITMLKGKPTLDEAVDHIQTNYPEFWNVVFADLEEGLDDLFKSSWFFTVASLVIVLYAMCECCCCPYRDKGEN